MGIFGFIALAIVSTAISLALQPRPEIKDARPSGFDDLKFPTTDRTRPRPMLFGTTEVKAPQVLSVSNYRAIPIEEEVDGGPFQSDKDVIVGYDYYLSVMLGLCLGPVDKIGHIRINDRPAYRPSSLQTIDPALGLELNFKGSEQHYKGRIMQGNNTQPPCGNPRRGSNWASISGFFGIPASVIISMLEGNHTVYSAPSDPNEVSRYNMRYRGLCYLNLDGYLGEQPQVKDIKATLQRLPQVLWGPSHYLTTPSHDIDDDANIAECIWDLVINSNGGLNRSPDEYDLTSFQEAAITMYNEGLGVSFLWDNSSTGATIVEELLKYADGVLRLNRNSGKYELKLIRGDYDPVTMRTITEDEIKEVRDLATPSFDKLANSVAVTYSDRELYFEKNVYNAHDIGSALDAARKESRTLNFPYITKGETAGAIAYRELRALSLPLTSFKIECNRRAYDVLIGDAVKVTYEPMGIFNQIVRVLDADYGSYSDGLIVLTVIQDRFAYEGSIFGDGSPGDYDTPSASPAQPVIEFMEHAPYALTKVENQREGIALVSQTPEGGFYASYQNPTDVPSDDLNEYFNGVRRSSLYGYTISEVGVAYDTLAIAGDHLGEYSFADISGDPGALTNVIRIGQTWGSFTSATKVLTPAGDFAYLLLQGVTLGRMTLAAGPYEPGTKVHFFSRGFDRTPDTITFTGGTSDDWRLRAVPVDGLGQEDIETEVVQALTLDSDLDLNERPYAARKIQDGAGVNAGPYPFAMTEVASLIASFEGQERVFARLYNEADTPVITDGHEYSYYVRDAYSWNGDNYTNTYSSSVAAMPSAARHQIDLPKASFWLGDVAPEYLALQVYTRYSSSTMLHSVPTGWFRVDPEHTPYLPGVTPTYVPAHTLTITNPGAEAGDLTGWTVTGPVTVATNASSLGPHSGTYYFHGGLSTATSQMYQDLAIPVAAETDIDAGAAQVLISYELAGHSDIDGDTSQLTLEFYDVGMGLLGTSTDIERTETNAWVSQSYQVGIPANTRTIRLIYDFVRYDGTNLNAYLDDIEGDILVLSGGGIVPLGGIFYDGATLYSVGVRGDKSSESESVLVSSSDGGATWGDVSVSSGVKWLHRIEGANVYGKSKDQGFVRTAGTTFNPLTGSTPNVPTYLGTDTTSVAMRAQVNVVTPDSGGDYFVGTDLNGIALVTAGDTFTDRGPFLAQMGDVVAAVQLPNDDYLVLHREHTYERLNSSNSIYYWRWGMTHKLSVRKMTGFDTTNEPADLGAIVTGEMVRDVHLEDLGAYQVAVFAQYTGADTYEVKAYATDDGGGTWTPLTLPSPVYRRSIVMVKAFGRAIFMCGDTVYSTDGASVVADTAATGTYCGLGMKDATTVVKISHDAGSLTVEETTDGVTWA